MTVPLIEPEEGASTSGGTVAATATDDGAGAASTAEAPAPTNPIDVFFAGTRWRRDDVVFLLAAINLVLVLINLWTMIRNTKTTNRVLEVGLDGV